MANKVKKILGFLFNNTGGQALPCNTAVKLSEDAHAQLNANYFQAMKGPTKEIALSAHPEDDDDDRYGRLNQFASVSGDFYATREKGDDAINAATATTLAAVNKADLIHACEAGKPFLTTDDQGRTVVDHIEKIDGKTIAIKSFTPGNAKLFTAFTRVPMETSVTSVNSPGNVCSGLVNSAFTGTPNKRQK